MNSPSSRAALFGALDFEEPQAKLLRQRRIFTQGVHLFYRELSRRSALSSRLGRQVRALTAVPCDREPV
jgi:hypothetical protein